MALTAPPPATGYDAATTAAVKSVLIEVGQILGGFKDKFAVVGGSVPMLLLDNADMPHVGTMDVDLALDARALGDGEYARLVEALMDREYVQREDLRRFQLSRKVSNATGKGDIEIIIDFLMPRDVEIVKNHPPRIDDFAVQRADGADLALQFKVLFELAGKMPDGIENCVQIAVASIPAFLAMKGHAIEGRDKPKDAYDIYYSIRNFPGGIVAIAAATRPLMKVESAIEGYRKIGRKFAKPDFYGPASVRKFVEESGELGDLSPEQWQQDAFGQVDAWVRKIGLR